MRGYNIFRKKQPTTYRDAQEGVLPRVSGATRRTEQGGGQPMTAGNTAAQPSTAANGEGVAQNGFAADKNGGYPRPHYVPTVTQEQVNAGVNGITDRWGNSAGKPLNTMTAGEAAGTVAKPAGTAAGAGGNDYVGKLDEQMKMREKAYIPDAENKGRGVANWFTRLFSGGNGGGAKEPRTIEESRRQIQNIALLGDVGRHIANLWGTSQGAVPQQIQSQVAMNANRWKAEDALAAEQAKAQREWQLKLDKQKADEAYKAGQLGLSGERNAIAKANLELSQGRYAMDADMHDVNKAAKQAGIDKTKHDMELGDKRFAETQRHNKVAEGQGQQRLALGWANHALSAQRAGGKSGGSVGVKGDGSKVYVTPKGTKYHLSKNFQDNIGQVYNDLVTKGVIKSQQAYDAFGRPVAGKTKRPSKQAMIEEVMKAADTNRGHANFVWWGKKLGYKYVDGTMSEEQKRITMPGQGIQGTNLGLG